jgi:hypothetical protein
MKYAVEMGSGAMTYIPSLIKIYSGIQKMKGGGGQISHKPKTTKLKLYPLCYMKFGKCVCHCTGRIMNECV